MRRQAEVGVCIEGRKSCEPTEPTVRIEQLGECSEVPPPVFEGVLVRSDDKDRTHQLPLQKNEEKGLRGLGQPRQCERRLFAAGGGEETLEGPAPQQRSEDLLNEGDCGLESGSI